ncbi:hypothetical protein E0500_011250 [Streptomyces sp. KM273126]|uniref:hypothetical protein n=1 Tax=Streptomyces sp. KM273126 TaxID=2545247 RepID=UPI00140495A8|nr:hypothetical protein [Streptomyces sp. KM273126]MBA2807971.1 hypothetical protein [Streptomyces sp. KM273126]
MTVVTISINTSATHALYAGSLHARLPRDVTILYSNIPRGTRSLGTLITTD